MRRWPPLILLTFAVLAIPSALAATKTVDITRAGFTPNKVTVSYGDSVTWTNKDNGSHQVLFDQAAWPTSPVLAQDQTYSVTFTKSGSFGYRDAFATNRRGTVTVRTGVTIAAAPATVRYGGSPTLSGSVSSGLAGESVGLDAKQCGATAFARVASVATTAGGGWSSPAKPVVNTVFQASWKNTKSPELTAYVAPALTLKRVRAGRFSVKVSAALGFAGKYVLVQRRTKTGWKAVKRVVLKKTAPGTAPTLVTSAAFRLRVPRRTRLRVQFPQDQAGACYAPALSRAIRA